MSKLEAEKGTVLDTADDRVGGDAARAAEINGAFQEARFARGR